MIMICFVTSDDDCVRRVTQQFCKLLSPLVGKHLSQYNMYNLSKAPHESSSQSVVTYHIPNFACMTGKHSLAHYLVLFDNLIQAIKLKSYFLD